MLLLTILDYVTKSSLLTASGCMATVPKDEQESAYSVFVKIKKTREWEIIGCDSHSHRIYSVNYFLFKKRQKSVLIEIPLNAVIMKCHFSPIPELQPLLVMVSFRAIQSLLPCEVPWEAEAGDL